MFRFLKDLFKPVTYQSELERYIIAHHPQSTYDVERLTQEFDKKQSKGVF